MPAEIIQDTIRFAVRAELTLVSETVKLIATVTAQVGSEVTPEALGTDVRNALRQFMPNAAWTFTNLHRAADDTGGERAQLTATARVPETENYNLEERARGASRPGLRIVPMTSDPSLSAEQLDKAETELRAAIITKVSRECEAIRAQTKRDYRIGRLVFLPNPARDSRKQGGSRGLSKTSYGTGFGDETSSPIANATKLTMQADVTLTVMVSGAKHD